MEIWKLLQEISYSKDAGKQGCGKSVRMVRGVKWILHSEVGFREYMWIKDLRELMGISLCMPCLPLMNTETDLDL